jgi:signal peptidase II
MMESRRHRTEDRRPRTDDPAPSAGQAAPAVGCSLSRLRAALPDRTGHLIFWPVALLGVAADLWTKAAVFSAVEFGEIKTIIDGWLTFRPVLNDGAAFGIAAGRQPLLVGVSLVALVALVGVFLVGGLRRRITQLALGLFVAGVCGNLWDRLFNGGHVRDFIDVVYWPGRHWNTFNVADALLCVAVGLLALASFLTPSSPSQTPAPPQKSAP